MTTFAYDAVGQLLSTTDPLGRTTGYTYDSMGRQLTETLPDPDGAGPLAAPVTTYTYGADGRLASATDFASQTVSYSYNSAGLISAMTDPRGTTTFTYDGLREERGSAGDHILLRFDEAENLTGRYLHGPNVDQILASEDVTSPSVAGDVLWSLTDHLGSIRDLAEYDSGTDTTSVVNHIVYDAYGQIISESSSAIDFLYGFTGRERDAESDLQYNRARYYDAAVGRWMSQDPIGFEAGDANLYRYARNAATTRIDPSGLVDGDRCRIGQWHYPKVDPETGTLPDDIPGVVPLDAPLPDIEGALDEVWESIRERERVYEHARRRGREDAGHWERILREREYAERLIRRRDYLRVTRCPTDPGGYPPVLLPVPTSPPATSPKPWIPRWFWHMPKAVSRVIPIIIIHPDYGHGPKLEA